MSEKIRKGRMGAIKLETVRMNVCILSMQRVQNFGSLLQSYALKRMLEDLGCSVSFIDIEPDQLDNALLEGRTSAYADEGEAVGTILSKLKKIDKYLLNRVRIKHLSGRQNVVFEQFRREGLGICEWPGQEHYDLCVIGSDEVFNCLSGAPWGFTSQLFGNVPQAKKVITYAASCGSTRCNQVPERVLQRIADTFRKVSAFSVRDENTRKFVLHLTGNTPQEHLDPVAVVDFSGELAEAKLPQKLSERYCIVYSYYNRICSEEEISQIRDFCKTHDLQPVAVGAPQKWIRDYLVLTPFEVLKVFSHAEFVITDTFHGTIFSAKYAKRFAVMIRNSNRNKLADLVQRLALQKHQIDSFAQLEKAYDVEKNGIHLKDVLEQERERTMCYLRDQINGAMP